MANSSEYENSTSASEQTSWKADSTSMAIFAGLNIFLAITASLGNALILIALHKVTFIYPPSKLLLRCLAVTDLLVGLISQPFYVIFLVSLNTKMNTDHLRAIDHIDQFLFSLLPQVSVLVLAAISVDRLLALFLGLRYRHTVTLRRVWLVVVCFWSISALTSSAATFFDDKTIQGIASWAFYVLITISVVISAFSYAKIFFTLRRQQAQIHGNLQQRQTNEGGNQLNIARYKKTVDSIAWVQLALLICYFPFNLMGFLRLLGKLPSPTETSILWELFVTLLYLNSSLNPALYCWRIRDVRQEVKNIICKIFRCF